MKDTKYKLYRTVKEILHPTISKKNISDYLILFGNDLLPVQVYYPKKVSNISQVIIFIHGNFDVTECGEQYGEVVKEMSLKTDCLLISVDYKDIKLGYSKMLEDIYLVVKHIYTELLECGIDSSKILLMGDSTGGHIVTMIQAKLLEDIPVKKCVLFYPTLSLEYFGTTKYSSITQNQDLNFNLINRLQKYYKKIISEDDMSNYSVFCRDSNIPKTLLFIGGVDCLKDENIDYCKMYDGICSYVELPFLSHGFLKRLEKDEKKVIYDQIIKLLNEKK